MTLYYRSREEKRMRKFFLYILAFFLFPFYPLLKRIQKMSEKMQFGEKIVVVTNRNGKKKRVIE
jgi:hypothetical protein